MDKPVSTTFAEKEGNNIVNDVMRAIVQRSNWGSTELGPISQWDPALISAVNLCLDSHFPSLILLGSKKLKIFNTRYRELFKPSANTVGQPVQPLTELSPGMPPWVEKVFTSGQSAMMENHSVPLGVEESGDERKFNSSCSAIRNSASEIVGVLIQFQEVTHKYTNETQSLKLRDVQLKNLFLQAPIALCLLRGPDFIVEVMNEKMLMLWGLDYEFVINKPLLDAIPNARTQGYEGLLNKAYKNGERIILEETSSTVERQTGVEVIYTKFVYEPLRGADGENISGVMVLADDITEQVLARKKVEESEIRYKVAIEAAAVGTFDWNIEGASFQHSERLARIFGYTDGGQLSQRTLGDRIHPDDQALRVAAHQQAFENGILFYEARIIAADQASKWIRVNGKVIYSIYGKPSRMYGTVLDITEQRQHSEKLEKLVEQRTHNLQERNLQLQRSEERYHKMIDEVQDYAIILLDRDGFIQNWNKGAEQIKRYQESEIIGKNFRIFYLPEDRENKLPERLIHDASQFGRAVHEGWRLRRDGSKFWGSIAITALHNNNREIIGFSKVTRDLTERKLAEDKLKAYTLELESQNRELEQFAYIASHDLQEPLRKIQTFCEVIQKNNHDEETTKRYFPKIITAAQRMAELIKSVLNYSRLSKEGQSFVDIDLNTVLANILVDFELTIAEKHATIEHENLPSISGIPLQISQLFTNLIGNALKFCKERPHIQIQSRQISVDELTALTPIISTAPYAEISVRDNGIGFDQKYEKLIFTMFQRLNSKHEYGGTGIGLALCKKIIENHNGWISVQSSPGHGSTFYVYLPLI